MTQEGQTETSSQIDYLNNANALHENEISRNLRYGISIYDQNLLFDQSIFCETNINVVIYPIPNLPHWLLGAINLRGNLVPVFKLDSFLSDQANIIKENKIVFVVGRGNSAIGLSISELPVTIEINKENVIMTNIPENTPEIFSDCINSAYKINGENWLEIDLHLLINNLNSVKN